MKKTKLQLKILWGNKNKIKEYYKKNKAIILQNKNNIIEREMKNIILKVINFQRRKYVNKYWTDY